MKESFCINLDSFENIEVVNALKYYYFGNIYKISNLKVRSLKKMKLFENLKLEIDNDVFLSYENMKSVKEIIYSFLTFEQQKIKIKLDAKKLKLITRPFKML